MINTIAILAILRHFKSATPQIMPSRCIISSGNEIRVSLHHRDRRIILMVIFTVANTAAYKTALFLLRLPIITIITEYKIKKTIPDKTRLIARKYIKAHSIKMAINREIVISMIVRFFDTLFISYCVT